ncbi:MAG: DUF4139 domain-containing protein [Sphingomonadales bacterium]|jgi:hypothetical protein
MKAFKSLLLSGLMATCAMPALAQDVVMSDTLARKDLSLTIYNGGIAMVRDSREISIPKGRVRLEIQDVAARIQPQTTIFNASGVTLLEQNFDYDLLSPQKLLEKAVGRTLKLVRTNPATGEAFEEKAELLSTNGGAILKIGDSIEILREDNLPARLVFSEVPPNLRARPTLSMLVQSQRSRKQDVDLTYLTNGMSWAADYVANYDEDKGRLSLAGWITLTNNSGTSFENAVTQVVAGDVNVGRDEIIVTGTRRADVEFAAQEAAVATEEALFDYHLYTLPYPTTVANNQSKQVSFINADAVKAGRHYRFDAYGFNTREEPDNAQVYIRFKNDKSSGLGAPLPKGVMRVYGQDKDERPQFLGADSIRHTAEGALVDLNVGRAFDVTVQATQVSYETLARSQRSQSYQVVQSYKLKNAREEAVTVEIHQNNLYGEWQVLEENAPHEKSDARTATWKVSVPAKGESELRFKIFVKT